VNPAEIGRQDGHRLPVTPAAAGGIVLVGAGRVRVEAFPEGSARRRGERKGFWRSASRTGCTRWDWSLRRYHMDSPDQPEPFTSFISRVVETPVTFSGPRTGPCRSGSSTPAASTAAKTRPTPRRQSHRTKRICPSFPKSPALASAGAGFVIGVAWTPPLCAWRATSTPWSSG
jgi:hypothetical protein